MTEIILLVLLLDDDCGVVLDGRILCGNCGGFSLLFLRFHSALLQLFLTFHFGSLCLPCRFISFIPPPFKRAVVIINSGLASFRCLKQVLLLLPFPWHRRARPFFD